MKMEDLNAGYERSANLQVAIWMCRPSIICFIERKQRPRLGMIQAVRAVVHGGETHEKAFD